MIWLLGEPEDTDLLWLAVSLQRRSIPAEFILVDELFVGSALALRIDTAGAAATLAVADGRSVCSAMPGLVVNRITGIPPIGGAIAPADAAYLAAEWQAALAAWLRALRCPVLNPPHAGSLSGPDFLPAAWRRLAHAHGVPAQPWASAAQAAPGSPDPVLEPAGAPGTADAAAETVEVVVLGTHCLSASGAPPPAVSRGLAALARFTGAPLLGATFARRSDEDWTLVAATAFPHFAQVGDQFVAALLAYAAGAEGAA